MALISGIDPDRWAELGEQAIVTAFDLLDEAAARSAQPAAPAGETTSSGREAPAGWESH